MNKYELLYIISSDAQEAVRKSVIEKVAQIITDNGGTIDKQDDWGMKKFAYPINFKTEGNYVLVNFTGTSSIPKKIEEYSKVTEAVVRFMFVKKA